jgi:hypothetical protein
MYRDLLSESVSRQVSSRTAPSRHERLRVAVQGAEHIPTRHSRMPLRACPSLSFSA